MIPTLRGETRKGITFGSRVRDDCHRGAGNAHMWEMVCRFMRRLIARVEGLHEFVGDFVGGFVSGAGSKLTVAWRACRCTGGQERHGGEMWAGVHCGLHASASQARSASGSSGPT